MFNGLLSVVYVHVRSMQWMWYVNLHEYVMCVCGLCVVYVYTWYVWSACVVCIHHIYVCACEREKCGGAVCVHCVCGVLWHMSVHDMYGMLVLCVCVVCV